LVIIFSGSMSPSDRTVIVYFLVAFPIIVLCVFAWLVSKHSKALFAPADFRDEANYVKMQLSAAVNLGVAAGKTAGDVSGVDVEGIVGTVQHFSPAHPPAGDSSRSRVLWVDDRPDNIIHERKAFEAIGLTFTLSLNTKDALDRLVKLRFAAVISNMGRKEGSREGYILLDAMRAKGDKTPLFFYTAAHTPEHKRETLEHGGQGCTNDPRELFQMVSRFLIRGSP